MPLQNRVLPNGEIVAIAQRGMFTGNRGIIHDPASRTLLKRRWTTKAWIACVCEFRGRRRDVMATRSWTELFFLDEATAFAAGHRPCFYCRRDDANAFRAAWAKGHRSDPPSAPQMDETLHRQRLDRQSKRLHPVPRGKLPTGAMLAAAENFYLIANERLWRWTEDGYLAHDGMPADARLLTPPAIVRVLTAGYRPVLHSTAA